MPRKRFLSLVVALVALGQAKTYTVVTPGTHPGIVFSTVELGALRTRVRAGGMA